MKTFIFVFLFFGGVFGMIYGFSDEIRRFIDDICGEEGDDDDEK